MTHTPSDYRRVPPMNAVARRYTCPMHPAVRRAEPGLCPECGMTLEPALPGGATTEWVCPMHAEVVRDAPGDCPICGMALEPRAGTAGEEESEELVDMQRRFVVAALLTVPLVTVAMGDLLPGPGPLHAQTHRPASIRPYGWFED